MDMYYNDFFTITSLIWNIYYTVYTMHIAIPPPSLGENIFEFFFGLNRLKMVWNVKKSKKNQGGGPAGAEIFLLFYFLDHF